MASTTILSRLEEILDQNIEELLEIRTSKENYDNSDWAYKMAHINGQLESLSTLRAIISSVSPQ